MCVCACVVAIGNNKRSVCARVNNYRVLVTKRVVFVVGRRPRRASVRARRKFSKISRACSSRRGGSKLIFFVRPWMKSRNLFTSFSFFLSLFLSLSRDAKFSSRNNQSSRSSTRLTFAHTRPQTGDIAIPAGHVLHRSPQLSQLCRNPSFSLVDGYPKHLSNLIKRDTHCYCVTRAVTWSSLQILDPSVYTKHLNACTRECRFNVRFS